MQACPYVLHHQLVLFITEKCRNYSGTKTEKLKNCFFQRDPGRDSPYGFSFSVFQFFSFSVFQFFSFGSGTIWKTETLDAYKQIVVLASMSWLCTSSSASSFQYGKVPELFRNTSGTKTEKLKNCFFQRDPGRDSPSVFQFFSFRNYSGIFPEKLKIWKTEFSRDIQAEILHMDSVFQFFAE